MSTASTKQDRRRQGTREPAPSGAKPKGGDRQAPPASSAQQATSATTVEGSVISERAWLILSIALLAVAAVLRFYALGLKPFHHDEGVNGFFLEKLLRQGVYTYDPTNYHGPTLYYLTLPSAALFGLNEVALRLVTALFGVGTVALVLGLRRYLGAVGALAAAALVAFSPGAVYYSRYFIHEALFVFFTLGIVVAALRFYETRAASYLWLLAASAALLFATKETAFMSAVTLVLATLVAWFVVMLHRQRRSGRQATHAGGRNRGRGGDESEAVGFGEVRALFGDSERAKFLICTSLALFIIVAIIFYSSFLTNLKGVADAFRALAVWRETGTSDFHGKDWHTYLWWLLQEESPILLLATLGSCIALAERRTNRFAVFAGAWAFGLLLAYSLVRYKTPWLTLNFVVPMAIIGGYTIEWFGRQAGDARRGHLSAALVTALALAVCGYQAITLNFQHYDDEQYPYVYSHTQREAVELVRAIEEARRRAGTETPGVAVAAPEYWPLPWYFRDNPHVGYEGRVSSYYDPKSTLAVIGRTGEKPQDQVPQLLNAVGTNYVRVGDSYPLRPGVRLVLFVRRDLAGN